MEGFHIYKTKYGKFIKWYLGNKYFYKGIWKTINSVSNVPKLFVLSMVTTYFAVWVILKARNGNTILSKIDQ